MMHKKNKVTLKECTNGRTNPHKGEKKTASHRLFGTTVKKKRQDTKYIIKQKSADVDGFGFAERLKKNKNLTHE